MVDHGRFIIGGHIRLGGCRQRSGAHRGRGWEGRCPSKRPCLARRRRGGHCRCCGRARCGRGGGHYRCRNRTCCRCRSRAAGSRRGYGCRCGFSGFLGRVHCYGHDELNARQVTQRPLDGLDVMLLDPRLDEIVVGGQHEEGVTHSLGFETREKSAHLGGVHIGVRAHLGADGPPLFIEFLAVHTCSLYRCCLPA